MGFDLWDMMLVCVAVCVLTVVAPRIIGRLRRSRTFEDCRHDYIRELLSERDSASIAKTIADVEASLKWGCGNVLEYEVQRTNLECLNTAYVLSLIEEDAARFWDLQKRSVQ